MALSPLTYVIEQARADDLGAGDGLARLWGWLAGSAVFAWLCFAWFQKTRKGFADVL
jgi:lipopolysaccharide transport system permease protein